MTERLETIAKALWEAENQRCVMHGVKIKTSDGKPLKWETLSQQGQADKRAWTEERARQICKALAAITPIDGDRVVVSREYVERAVKALEPRTPRLFRESARKDLSAALAAAHRKEGKG